MHKRFSRFIQMIHFIGDICLINFSFIVVFAFRFPDQSALFFEKYLRLLIFFNIFWGFTVVLLMTYNIQRITRVERIIVNQFKAIFLHVFLISTLIVIFKAHGYSRFFLFYVYALFLVLLLSWRMFSLVILKWYRKLGFNYRKVVIVGAGPVGTALLRFFNSDQSYGYHFVGFFDDNPARCQHKDLVIGNIEDSKDFIVNNKIDEIYFALPDYAGDKVRDLIKFADKNLVRVKIIPDFMRHISKQVVINFYGSIPTLTFRKEPLESYRNQYAKRLFDIVFSIFIIVFILSWLVPLISILILSESKGPVFYTQTRNGKDNRDFKIWKFRSLKVTHSDEDFTQVVKNDSSITKVGRVLRRTNLDEIPQFINVLLGNMSVVGPRPHPIMLNEQYKNIIEKYMIRNLVKPGITGVAQINGFRGETKNHKLMEKRVKLDVWYIENWSFLLDMKLIIQTVINMIRGDKHAF